MMHSLTHTSRFQSIGWIGIGAVALLYGALYAANYWLPLTTSNYTTRIWEWSQLAITLAACVTLVRKWHLVTPGSALLGLGLALLSALSHALHDPSVRGSLLEGGAVWLCFLGGVVLLRDGAVLSIPAFQPPAARLVRNIVLGIVVAIPLALINNLYFYATVGTLPMQDGWWSAFEALSPAIHEEIIFRFFVLAFCMELLRNSALPRLRLSAALFLAVVPHSLNHLPDVFLHDPVMGFVLLTATSLLFGLPMALLQIKRSLETAIAFHWFIDFTRFLLGF